ncbi:MAG: ECF-type sigma factor [Pseudomonadota bacterium]
MNEARTASGGDVTRLLRAYSAGSEESFNELIPIVYRELKTIAHAQLRRSGIGSRMQTTMLVHEAYEKLMRGQTQHANDRRHFFGIASRAMRQIVVDAYRAESTAKRGAGIAPEALVTNEMLDFDTPDRVLQFDQAMERLAAENEALAEVVDLSCFGGLTTEEIASLTGANIRTVQRQLARAQAWIGTFLDDSTL